MATTTTTTHAIEEMVSVRHGVIIGCRCGWTFHSTDVLDPRKDARKAMATHKAEALAAGQPRLSIIECSNLLNEAAVIMADAIAKRDAIIMQCHQAGMSHRFIADTLGGMTAAQVSNVVAQA